MRICQVYQPANFFKLNLLTSGQLGVLSSVWLTRACGVKAIHFGLELGEKCNTSAHLLCNRFSDPLKGFSRSLYMISHLIYAHVQCQRGTLE